MKPSCSPSALFLVALSGAAASACAGGSAPVSSPADTDPSASASAAGPVIAPTPGCPKELIVELAGTTVWKLPGGKAIAFKAGMTIDADGAPKAYHQDDSKALDALSNAGRAGKWAALVTDTGKPDGKPIVQGRGDPAPGYFVSMTALFDKNKPARSPARYVDATAIPYVALPPEAKEWGAKLGDFAVVLNAKSGRLAFAEFADIGPPAKLGEGSVALAESVGIASSAKDGGLPFGVIYAIFPGSGNGAPRTAAEIDAESKKLFDALGGRKALATCFRS
jgi:hypothetical protein